MNSKNAKMHIDPQICEIHNRILWDWGLGARPPFIFFHVVSRIATEKSIWKID
jgi:hypothetical protein